MKLGLIIETLLKFQQTTTKNYRLRQKIFAGLISLNVLKLVPFWLILNEKISAEKME